ncbi:MAG: pyruvate kinase [Gammaproteobacteria bacterium]|nr:pyruvate kinase [Gammaproteobacteria bacterium]
MIRRTKIVTTLGPATDNAEVLEAIIRAGANMVRLNFSHGAPEDQIKRAEVVREIATRLDIHVAILGDLQGPKIRVSTFKDNKVFLRLGDSFILDSDLEKGHGDEHQVGLDYKSLPQEVVPGDVLLLDDGRLQLQVTQVQGNRVTTEVIIEGQLSNNKGINKKGGGLSAAALTEKDKADIRTAAAIGVDYLAISFPRRGEDLHYARRLARDAGLETKIIAKVERAETVVDELSMDDIIIASDGVMVARGDLGVEIGDPELVGVQKQLIRRTRQSNKPVITATQMMESMISSPMPTRAEVMDVANAVLDGTDAVMLSGETAVGKFPVKTVEAMANVCLGAEKQASITRSKYRIDYTFDSICETMSMATMFAANHMSNLKGIIALTEMGITPLLMSRLSSGLPIFALSRHNRTLNKCALYRGVYPVFFNESDANITIVANAAMKLLTQKGLLCSGELVMLTHGDTLDLSGSTNTSKMLIVP